MRRVVAAVGAAGLLALGALTACAEDEPASCHTNAAAGHPESGVCTAGTRWLRYNPLGPRMAAEFLCAGQPWRRTGFANADNVAGPTITIGVFCGDGVLLLEIHEVLADS